MKQLLPFLALVVSACGGGVDHPIAPPTTSSANQVANATVGQVFTMSNASAGNTVMAFDRASDGSLTLGATYATGGNGSGGGLGNQSALIITKNDKFLLVVNPGSNDVTTFRIRTNRTLELLQRISSGGTRPISITDNGNLVYVLNAGGSGNIAGFTINATGRLAPIAGATLPLSPGGGGASQVQFQPNGRRLVVTEKANNVIDTYSVNSSGVAVGPVVNASVGATPFGFSFAPNGLLVVSEAFGGAPGASAASSYFINDNLSLRVISPSVGTTETAACWIVITPNGRFAYASNTGSGTISGFRITAGSLVLLNADGVTASTGGGPIDLALTGDGQFLYSLNAGDHTISAFATAANGSLTSTGGASGLPASANGLAAR